VADIALLIEPIIEDQSMELVDLEFRRERSGWVLRLFIDREGGVTLDDCADISGRVGAVLDVQDIIDVSYVLEVSSPGVNRPLRKEKDFQRFTGHHISFTTVQSIDGQKNFKGLLMGLREDNLLFRSDEGREVNIPLGNVARAHINYRWDEAAPGGHRVCPKGNRR